MARPPDLEAIFARRRRRLARRRRQHRAAAVAGTLAAGAAVFVALIVLGAGAALSTTCSLSSLHPVNIGQNTLVYAANGELLGTIPADRNRDPVPQWKMSRWVRRATVAVEDRRFYQHGGIDYRGILRALWDDIKAGRIVEGGSTIEQQLVRNLYTGSERTFERKLKEACLAIKLGDRWSKRRILTAYLNDVYYGNHAYGVEAAAETYFSEHAAALTLPQSALLAGLPQAPSIYDPLENPGGALQRRDAVLRAMLVNHEITWAEFHWARHQPLDLRPGSIYTTIKQPYFFSYVIDQLESAYGAETVREGGLRVYTTIEPRLQVEADRAIRQTLYVRDDPAAAIVSIVPGTGAIRAMTAVVPGRPANEFNVAAQSARQAGSTFKPFVLAAAIARGMNPDTTYYTSAPFTCTSGYWCAPDAAAGHPWTVTTFSHTYAGTISVTDATLQSDNTVYAQLTLDVGPWRVWRMAERLGVHLSQRPVASIGLGALAVSPLDMAAAYATFASGGIYARPTAIRKVVLPNGQVDRSWGTPERHRVLSPGVAWEVNQVLSLNALQGTGAGSGDGIHPNAGKTGTTQNFADAWYDGYTRNLSTVVWMGYEGGEIPMLDVQGQQVEGATYCVPIWHLYMASALQGLPAIPFLTATPPPYTPWVHTSYGYLVLPKPPPPVQAPGPAPAHAPKPAPTPPRRLAPPTPLQSAILAAH